MVNVKPLYKKLCFWHFYLYLQSKFILYFPSQQNEFYHHWVWVVSQDITETMKRFLHTQTRWFQPSRYDSVCCYRMCSTLFTYSSDVKITCLSLKCFSLIVSSPAPSACAKSMCLLEYELFLSCLFAALTDRNTLRETPYVEPKITEGRKEFRFLQWEGW